MGVSSPMEPMASALSSTIGCRIISSSSSVVPTASCRRRSSSAEYCTVSGASVLMMPSSRVIPRVHSPNGWRPASRSFNSSSR